LYERKIDLSSKKYIERNYTCSESKRESIKCRGQEFYDDKNHDESCPEIE
jgi:hypothetical protein